MKRNILYVILFALLAGCTSPEEKLMNNIQSGNLTEVNKLLMEGVNPNNALKNGLTPLTLAIEISKSKIITTLIEFDADINLKDSHGYSPIVKAVSTGNIKIISILLDAGCDVNMEDSLSQTVLLSLCNVELLEKLKEEEVDLDSADDKGVTLTMRAAETGNFELLKFLVSDEVERIYIEDSLGKTVFDYVQKVNNDSIQLYLAEAKRIDEIWPKVGSIVYFARRYYSGSMGWPAGDDTKAVVVEISGDKYLVKALEAVKRPSNNNKYWLSQKHIARTREELKKDMKSGNRKIHWHKY